MQIKTKLNSRKIVDKEFKAKRNGYDALEVDEFLDEVVDDYVALEQYVNALEKKVDDLQKDVKLYKTRLDQAEIQNEIMSKKLENISENDNASLSNLEYLKRISLLEQALFKAGIDPSKIK
jgi:DivIVA domain-containing protein